MASARITKLHELADYVLSDGKELQDLKQQLADLYGDLLYNRTQLRQYAEEHIWFTSMNIRYGRQQARKDLTELLNALYKDWA